MPILVTGSGIIGFEDLIDCYIEFRKLFPLSVSRYFRDINHVIVHDFFAHVICGFLPEPVSEALIACVQDNSDNLQYKVKRQVYSLIKGNSDKEQDYNLNETRLDLEIQAYYLLQKDFSEACLLFNKIHNCNVTVDSMFPYKLKGTESSSDELIRIVNRLKNVT